MNKETPSINKIVQFKDYKRNWQLHENKLRDAKPTLTTRQQNPSKTNLRLNKTAKQPFGNSFSRMIDIDFQNKSLLKKLTDKSTGKTTNTINNNSQNPWNKSQYKLSKNNRKKYYQQYQRRIQNQGLLRRIKQTKPLYQMQKYVSERKKTQRYINSIAKFGYKDYRPNKTLIKFEMRAKREGEYLHLGRGKGQTLDWVQDKVDCNRVKSDVNLFRAINRQPSTARCQNSMRKQNPTHQKRDLEPDQEINDSKLNVNNSSFMRSSRYSRSNSPSRMQNSVINFIPQKQIKINGKYFTLMGRQYSNKIQLQILDSKNKQIGNHYIHEVQISTLVYTKKFQGKIGILIQNLKFDNKNQAFYLN